MLQIEYGLGTDQPVPPRRGRGETGIIPPVLPRNPATVVQLKIRFGLTEVVLVGDRGMLTSARIEGLRERGPGLDQLAAGTGHPQAR